ncbi:MAG TPA: phosphatase PAP2 family protein [Gemmatimonadales bacterium]|nr:phosphatase PAP2 family protein [Gemmatimonadales bacterium]
MADIPVEALASRIGSQAVLLLALVALLLVSVTVFVAVAGTALSRRRRAIRRVVGGLWRRSAGRAVPWLPEAAAGLARFTPGRYLLLHLASGLLLSGALLAFLSLAEAVREGGWLRRFDLALAYALDQSKTVSGLRIFGVLTTLGSGYAIATLGAVVAGGLLWRGRRLLCLGWVAALAGAGLLNWALKALYRRARPEFAETVLRAESWSFPSGHAMATLVTWGMLCYLLVISERAAEAKIASLAFSLVWILVIGFSRLYLNAHYFSDVLAGYAAGAVWLAACVSGLEIARRHRRRRPRGTTAAG